MVAEVAQPEIGAESCPDEALADFERFCQWVESFPKETSYVGMGLSERACPIQKYLTAQCADKGYRGFMVGASRVKFWREERDGTLDPKVVPAETTTTPWASVFVTTFDNYVGNSRANKATVKRVIERVRDKLIRMAA